MSRSPELKISANGKSEKILIDSNLEPVVFEARKLTSDFYSGSKLPFSVDPKIPWAFYDRFFQDIAQAIKHLVKDGNRGSVHGNRHGNLLNSWQKEPNGAAL